MSNNQTVDFERLLLQFMKDGKSETILNLLKFLKQHKYYYLFIYLAEIVEEIFVYDLEFESILADVYKQINLHEKSYNLYNDILTSSKLNPTDVKKIIKEQQSLIPHVRLHSEYPQEKIQMIKPYKIPFITLTITTCKRLELFKRTINSFINCCTDYHFISYWICIDDNSSESDREEMKRLYPFFRFYFKNPSEKGHAKSMNIIRKMVTTPYALHLEDDWEFFSVQSYIQPAIEILNNHNNIGQVLFNCNYAETEAHIDTIGGFPSSTKYGTRYIIHDYEPNNQSFKNKYGYGLNCGYWPHYSLRPGIFKKSVLDVVGEFSETANHFEMDYAYRYVEKGFFTAFFENISCYHIGRLTSERDSDKENAYVLNEMPQFCGKNKEEERNLNYGCYVVNLEHRKDRWSNFVNNAIPYELKYERYNAVNGYELVPTRELEQLFDNCDYNFRRGMIGCALSHLHIWEIVSKQDKPFIIFEDDVTFSSEFNNNLPKIFENNFDVCFIGHHSTKNIDEYGFSILKFNARNSLSFSLGGTFGYIITPDGAKKMLDFIQEVGMINGIDTMMQKSADVLNIKYCIPSIVFSSCIQHDPNSDTDIQKNYDSMRRHNSDRFDNECEWLEKNNIPWGCIYNVDKISFCLSLPENLQLHEHVIYEFCDMYYIIPKKLYEIYPVLKNYRMIENGFYNVENLIKYK
jgi:GR25 family glycosyltransferase involved in LPS biosynthesis/GT2 family glycosyltransferase